MLAGVVVVVMDVVATVATRCPEGHPATVEILRIEVTTNLFTHIRGLGRCETCEMRLVLERTP